LGWRLDEFGFDAGEELLVSVQSHLALVELQAPLLEALTDGIRAFLEGDDAVIAIRGNCDLGRKGKSR